MKFNALLTTLVVCLATLSATASFAGGPIITPEEPFLTEVRPQGDGGNWVIPTIVGAIVICAIICGGSDDEAPVATGPETNCTSDC